MQIKLRPINKEILRLALPAILNNITVPLLGLSDTAISGHLGHPAYIGAIAVGSMMLSVIFWLCGFLRAGTTGLTANALGAANMTRSRDILRKAFIIAGIISLLVLILQVPLMRLLLLIIAPDETVRLLAETYFLICIWATPAQLGIMVISGWFIGMQNTSIPATVAIGVNVINIALSISLVFGFHIGFAGIAIGTLCANWIGFFSALIFLRHKLRKISTPLPHHSDPLQVVAPHSAYADNVNWGEFFSVNSNLFVRSACIMGVSLTVTAVGAQMGETILAVNALLMQFFLFFSYFMDGFAFAGEALVGKAKGETSLTSAQSSSSIHAVVKALLQWGAGMAATFFVIYLFGAHWITTLLTDEAPVIAAADSMLPWVMALPPITVAAFLFDGVYIGLTETRTLLVTTLIAASIFFITTFIFGGTHSNHILWLGFELYLFTRGLLLFITYRRCS